MMQTINGATDAITGLSSVSYLSRPCLKGMIVPSRLHLFLVFVAPSAGAAKMAISQILVLMGTFFCPHEETSKQIIQN